MPEDIHLLICPTVREYPIVAILETNFKATDWHERPRGRACDLKQQGFRTLSFLPAKAEREAAARKIQLQADADVLGADAVALREVLAGADGMSFLGVPTFLENLFARLGQNRSNSQTEH